MNKKELKEIARMNTNPLQGPRSLRSLNIMVGTSVPAGRVTPLAAIQLLREDTLRSSSLLCKADIMEAVEAVRNGIKVRFMAWFVPYLAFEKFDGGMDEFNRSYMKVANANGGVVTPFYDKAVLGVSSSVPIHKYLGEHHTATDDVNLQNIQAYNAVINFRLRNRSETLYQAKKRLQTDTSLAPAFWQHEQFKYVVPDWDDKAMEGSVNLTFTTSQVPVTAPGLGAANAISVPVSYSGTTKEVNVGSTVNAASKMLADIGAAGISFSLANLDLAEKIRGYAEYKAGYEGLTDEYVKDLLMQGISVPEQVWKQPILLADKTEIAGLDKRYATDGANLTNAVVNGEAYCRLDMVMPRCPTGGLLLVTAEILPDQLWERMRSTNLFIKDPDDLPRADRDDMDPQQVQRMSMGQVDASHATPDALFGYYPQNWWWQASYTRLGGKFHRPTPVTAFNQDRAQFWTNDVVNPAMNANFMLSETVNQFPFVATTADVCEVQMGGKVIIEGNTIFGPQLIENDNAYNEVYAKVPTTRIVKGV